MKQEKYLSIITNFGCHFNCPYCIVKNNNIGVPYTTMESLDKLKDAVEAEKATIISVSGGGDPLYQYYAYHRNYYRKLFNICREINLPLEIHTSYIGSPFPYYKCYRVVYHIRSLYDLAKIHRYNSEIIRVVFVVTKNFTKEMIDAIADYVHNSVEIDELSFRQMVDKNYQTTYYCYDYLKAGHKKLWWYIEQNDYNTYFVNGKLYYKYSEISEEN